MYEVYSNSTIGSKHIDKGIVCQDYSGSYSRDDTIIVAVSDGHGSPQYFRSNRGAKIAVEVALQSLYEFSDAFDDTPNLEASFPISELLDKRNQEAFFKQLFKSIVTKWCEKVELDYDNCPFAEDDFIGLKSHYIEKYRKGDFLSAYGATLIAALITKNFWLAIQIGDGKLVSISKECKCSQPIPWDDDCVASITTSLCQKDAADRFRYYIDSELPSAICMGSDGVDDTYGDGELLETFYSQLILEFAEMGTAVASSEIDDLLPDVTARGSHDDISIGLIFDRDAINKEVLKRQIEVVKLRDDIERIDYKIRRLTKKVTNNNNQEKDLTLENLKNEAATKKQRLQTLLDQPKKNHNSELSVQ